MNAYHLHPPYKQEERSLTQGARKCVFLGFKPGTKGFQLYDLNSREVFVSRDTLFYEDVFPFLHRSHQSPSSLPISDIGPAPSPNNTPIPQPAPPIPDLTNSPTLGHHNSPIDHSNFASLPDTTTQSDIDHSPPQPTRISSRTRKTPSHLKDYHCFLTTHDPPHAFTYKHPLSKYLSYDRLSSTHKYFLVALSIVAKPSSYKEAIQEKCWQEAIQVELYALDHKKTWTLTLLPVGKNTVGCKLVFKVKFKGNGEVEGHKARLELPQTTGIVFVETFSPVVKLTTVRMLLSIATIKNWHLHQLDVNTTFLYGDLNEEVYMEIPPGLHVTNSTLGCKLQKILIWTQASK